MKFATQISPLLNFNYSSSSWPRLASSCFTCEKKILKQIASTHPPPPPPPRTNPNFFSQTLYHLGNSFETFLCVHQKEFLKICFLNLKFPAYFTHLLPPFTLLHWFLHIYIFFYLFMLKIKNSRFRQYSKFQKIWIYKFSK